MPVTVVLGALWGDEGKAKIVDALAEDMDAIVRFQGGCNAGHTVVHGDDIYKFHIIPVGILDPDMICIIGNGVVINLERLLIEIEETRARGIELADRFFISSQSHVTIPIHTYLDELAEKLSGKRAIGTTKSGIGPTYSDKSARLGLRMGDLLDKEYLRYRLRNMIRNKEKLIEDWLEELNFDDSVEMFYDIGQQFKPYITNTPYLIHSLINENKNLLFEGAQGTLLDIDFGSYPFVTSSNTTIGGAITGSGISSRQIDKIVGVVKAYCTRVGNGPFPTEQNNEIGDYIRERGKEYGTTTGRPRRCGWFDAVAAKYSTMLNGFDELALTLLDIYSGLETIEICTSYDLDGLEIGEFPVESAMLEKVTPRYVSLPGWKEEISSITIFEDLPKNAQRFITTIEELLETPVTIISVGAKRSQTIYK
ncbi:MAG TPA: adenylosuccinate synthase [Candidatus Cloacimonetes bacterium]|nr:adenylosuccinate synthase [Candidatus Cloacimonadota bacterium]HEX37657.1 adenylosuccinate synthase [Candidatus Cloacimonadota bacterium]